MDLDNFRQQIGRNLADLREEAGLSQSQLADIVGYSRFAISRRESGETPIDLYELPKFMLALGVEDPSAFLGGRDSGRSNYHGIDF